MESFTGSTYHKNPPIDTYRSFASDSWMHDHGNIISPTLLHKINADAEFFTAELVSSDFQKKKDPNSHFTITMQLFRLPNWLRHSHV